MHEHTKRTDNNTNSKHEWELPFGIPPQHRGLRGGGGGEGQKGGPNHHQGG